MEEYVKLVQKEFKDVSMKKCDKCGKEVEKTFSVGDAELCINCYLDYAERDIPRRRKSPWYPRPWYPKRKDLWIMEF